MNLKTHISRSKTDPPKKQMRIGGLQIAGRFFDRRLRNAFLLALGLILLIAGIVYANTYVSYSSDSTFPTTNTLTLSGMTVGQSLTVSTDNSNSITVNDDTPGNINNRKVKCRDSIPAMSGGRISSGNPDYQFELYYQSTQINCATTASSFFFSSQTGPQTANLTPMTLRLVKVGSSGSTATITYPTFQMCNLDTSTSDSSGACFTGTPTGQLVRYTPTTSFATVVVNQAPVVDANQNFMPELTEGVMEVAVALYDATTGQLLAFGYTNESGIVRFAGVMTSGPVRVTIPFLNYVQTIAPGQSELRLRIAPRQLPNIIP